MHCISYKIIIEPNYLKVELCPKNISFNYLSYIKKIKKIHLTHFFTFDTLQFFAMLFLFFLASLPCRKRVLDVLNRIRIASSDRNYYQKQGYDRSL